MEDQLESNYMFPHWPDDLEDTIVRSMKTAEAKALEIIKLLGMDSSLLRENILEESSGVLQFKGNLEIVNDETELLSSGDVPDENSIIDQDDIESLSAEDTLATVLLNDREQATRNDLIDIAACTSQVTSVCTESQQQENFISPQEPNSSKSVESQFSHKSTKNDPILSNDSPEMVFGKRNLKETDANAGSKHLQRNPHSYVCHEGQIYHIAKFLAWQQGRLYIPSTGRQNRFLFVAHDKRYEVFLSSEENNNSSKLRRKEVICLWNNHDFLVGQIERMTTIPTRGKNAHPLFDWKISKTDHVRLVVNSFVSGLDCENSTKISNKMFRSRKYTVLDSFRFVRKISATPSSEGILLLDDKILSEIEGHRQRLEMQQKKLKKAEEKEKNEKIERMKQGPAENMTVAVLKQLLKDKGIAFS